MGWRSWGLAVPVEGRVGFTRLGVEATGLSFTNQLAAERGATNRVLWNGSGLAVGDVNGDGLPDLYACRLEGTNALYLNQGGLRFREVTEEAGLALSGRHDRGAVLADVNGDGPLDLLVATTGLGVRCFLNDGKGRFREVSRAVGTLTRFGAMTLALADVNGDGFLDLYVCNYRREDIKDLGRVELPVVGGRSVVPPAFADWLVIRDGQLLQYGEPDVLYLNNGRSGFEAVSWTGGAFVDEDGKPLVEPPRDWGLSATFRDLNADGFPDLYVCNDFWTPDRIWLGNGRGGFRALPRLAMRKMSGNSMGVDVGDLDADGRMDLLVVEMLGREVRTRKRQLAPAEPETTGIGEMEDRPQVLRNTLFRNRGDGTYAEVAAMAGLAASDWSWSPVFLDVDLDGYEDVLISAGHVHDLLDADARRAIEVRGAMGGAGVVGVAARVVNDRLLPRLAQPIVAFRNHGDWRFEDVTGAWGTGAEGVHHALATADFDGDGDLDLVVNPLGSALTLYRNDAVGSRVAVRLKGRAPNGQGIGARVTLLGGAVPRQTREVLSGGRYMAGAEALSVFAAGAAGQGMTLEVVWRSGRRSRVEGVRANRIYEIDEAGAQAPGTEAEEDPEAAVADGMPWFRDVSAALDHRHRDESFDDHSRQPLLHLGQSRFGGGVGWVDWNGDGTEDLVLGTGRGGRMEVRLSDGGGGWRPADVPAWSQAATQDWTGVAAWRRGSGPATVMVGMSGYEGEGGAADGGGVWVGNAGAGTMEGVLRIPGWNPGPLAVGDMDGDGSCEVFVGGGSAAGRYPLATPSVLLRFEAGRWRPDPGVAVLLADAGLVRAARWADLEGDGYPELMLACEWGPVRILRNRKGRLEAWDAPVVIRGMQETDGNGNGNGDGNAAKAMRLGMLQGWWTGLAIGDLDKDGRLDWVAGNWGWNSPYRASVERPLVFRFGEFRGGPWVDLIETEWDPVRRLRTPSRRMGELAGTLPWLPARFSTHRAYAEASVEEVLGDAADQAGSVSATVLASMAFLNRGDRFEAIPLPREAQESVVFGVSVADADGDGNEDVFLAQNFFGTRPELGRMDGGRGLWLRGDGAGGLKAVGLERSGVAVDGEGRGTAVADFNRDGRPDLVVMQHGAATRLFENVGGRRGLRVRVEGPAGNPDGIGAVLRWAGSEAGPAREVSAGTGWGSQDGAVQVMAAGGEAGTLEVRWPGGKVGKVRVPEGAGEVVVKYDEAAGEAEGSRTGGGAGAAP